eukprot:2174522-Rhodomonas_salina.1
MAAGQPKAKPPRQKRPLTVNYPNLPTLDPKKIGLSHVLSQCRTLRLDHEAYAIQVPDIA